MALLRWGAAAALLAVGIDHLDQYSAGYSAIPTIGTLFALNFVAAAVLAVALVVPVRPLRGLRVSALLSAGGLTVAGGTLAGLLVSEDRGLFGFMEVGYRPAIVVSIALDALAMVLLGALLIATTARETLRAHVA
jgi:hypothetical protein